MLSDNINYNQQQSIGNFFELVGQVLLTIGAQNQNLGVDSPPPTNNGDSESNNYEPIINILKNKIANIEEIVNDLKNIKL